MSKNLFLPNLSPIQIISTGSFTGLLLIAYITWIALQQPWLGIQIQYQPGESTLKIIKVLENSPAYNILKAGDEIVAFKTEHHYVPVTPFLNMEDPDSNPTYDTYNKFMHEQTKVHQLLQLSELTLKLKNKDVTIYPQSSRGISSLNIYSYWMIVAFGFVALVIVLSIWSFQRGSPHIQILGLLGVGFFFGATLNAAGLSREIVLDGDLFHKLSSLNLLGIILFNLSITALLWNYPKKLSPFPTTYLIYSLYPILWINQTWQIIEFPIHAYYLHFLLAFIFLVIFAFRQWYQSRNSLVEKAAIYWLLLSITLSLGFTFAFFFIPTMYSSEAYIPVSGTYFAAFMLFIGISMGVIKYRLFNISQTWLEIWMWIMSGGLVLAIDLSLIYLLNITSGFALILSIVIAGWIYFPARQWFAVHILKIKQHSIEHYFPVLIEQLIDVTKGKTFSEKWNVILDEVFAPSHIAIHEMKCEKVKIKNNGINLIVPSLDKNQTIELSYRDNGKNLYSKKDIILCKSLYDLTLHISNFKKSQDEGLKNERSRIARDLHDDTAAQILTLIHSTNNDGVINKSQKILKSLRETIYSLDSEATIELQIFLQKLYEIADERIKSVGLKLQCESIILDTDKTLLPRQHINLQRIFQEVISNIIKHAHASHVQVTIAVNNHELQLEICDDGIGGDTHSWVPGKGLNNIRTRVKEINGSVSWHQNKISGNNSFAQGCYIKIEVPL